MALKQLRLQKAVGFKRSELMALQERDAELKKRSEELEKALDESENEEDLKLVEGEIDDHEKEVGDHTAEKKRLEEEIQGLESELEEIEKDEPEKRSTSGGVIQTRQQQQITNGVNSEMATGKHETRAQMLARLNQPEVREFYAKLKEAVINKRALSSTDLVIPEAVLDRVTLRMGDYSKLLGEVEVIDLVGSGRVVVDGAEPEAIWTEMCDEVQEMNAAFEQVEVDGYKVGGFIPVCNALLEDSMLNLANYVETRIAKAIAKAIDRAILLGTGAAGKQPEGIIPALTAVESDGQIGNVLTNLATIDTGEDDAGEIIAVMSRATYYSRFMAQTITFTSDGRQVVQSVANPNLAGLRVVLSNHMPANQVLFGDFKKYLLARRSNVSITSSTDVRFIQDETVFKGTARYDGKPVDEGAFALVELGDGEPAGA